MKLYVWDCFGFECGLYVAVAPSAEAARELLVDQLGRTPPMLLLLPAVYDLDQSIAFKHECCQS